MSADLSAFPGVRATGRPQTLTIREDDATDVQGLPEPTLLVQTEMHVDARARLDAAIALHMPALDTRDVTVTVSECGRPTRAWLVEDKHLAPTQARRLMWVARRLPAHLGRRQRTWTTAQRRAARLRDGGCTWPRCQASLDRCDLHHESYWSHGGNTDLNNSLHSCTFHHWLVHRTNWRVWRNKDGTIDVSRT